MTDYDKYRAAVERGARIAWSKRHWVLPFNEAVQIAWEAALTYVRGTPSPSLAAVTSRASSAVLDACRNMNGGRGKNGVGKMVLTASSIDVVTDMELLANGHSYHDIHALSGEKIENILPKATTAARRETLRMIYVGGMSLVEIAKVQGKTTSAVSMLRRDGINDIKKSIKNGFGNKKAPKNDRVTTANRTSDEILDSLPRRWHWPENR